MKKYQSYNNNNNIFKSQIFMDYNYVNFIYIFKEFIILN